MPTAISAINRALAILTIKSGETELTDNEKDDALIHLNAMMMEWDALGYHLGYLNPQTTDDEMGVPDWSQTAIWYNLAVRIAPEYGKAVEPSIEFHARNGMKSIMTKTMDPIFTVYPSILPTGAGNSGCSGYNAKFFGDRTKNDLLNQQKAVDTGDGDITGVDA